MRSAEQEAEAGQVVTPGHSSQHQMVAYSIPKKNQLSRSRANGTIAQHGTAQGSTAKHSAAQLGEAQRSAAQHSTAQHSTAQHSTAQHTAWPDHSTAQLSRGMVFTTKAGDVERGCESGTSAPAFCIMAVTRGSIQSGGTTG